MIVRCSSDDCRAIRRTSASKPPEQPPMSFWSPWPPHAAGPSARPSAAPMRLLSATSVGLPSDSSTIPTPAAANDGNAKSFTQLYAERALKASHDSCHCDRHSLKWRRGCFAVRRTKPSVSGCPSGAEACRSTSRQSEPVLEPAFGRRTLPQTPANRAPLRCRIKLRAALPPQGSPSPQKQQRRARAAIPVRAFTCFRDFSDQHHSSSLRHRRRPFV